MAIFPDDGNQQEATESQYLCGLNRHVLLADRSLGAGKKERVATASKADGIRSCYLIPFAGRFRGFGEPFPENGGL